MILTTMMTTRTTRPTMRSGVMLNKCNQCDNASLRAGDLKTHLKTHSGEKSNKCNYCDFAYFYVNALMVHFKTHSGEKSNKCNQCDYASSQESKQSEATFENAHWSQINAKVEQMQPL